MKDVIARLKEHQSPTPSKWRERAEWRMQNKSWLRHSQSIAVKMLEKMDELSMTQKQLADLMGCAKESTVNRILFSYRESRTTFAPDYIILRRTCTTILRARLFSNCDIVTNWAKNGITY